MPTKFISSRANPLFRHARHLADSAKARRSHRQTLLDGEHLIESYLAHGHRPVAVFVASGAEGRFAGLLARAGGEVVSLSGPLLKELSPVEAPTGVLALVAVPPPAKARGGAALLLEGIQDPGNLGSLLRSARAAGVDEVYLSPGCADLWSPRVLRAAMGAHFGLALFERTELGAVIGARPAPTFAAVGRGGDLPYGTELGGPVGLLLGNEGGGLSPGLLELAGGRLSIPMAPGVESLNVAAAGAVLLFEHARQREALKRS